MTLKGLWLFYRYSQQQKNGISAMSIYSYMLIGGVPPVILTKLFKKGRCYLC